MKSEVRRCGDVDYFSSLTLSSCCLLGSMKKRACDGSATEVGPAAKTLVSL